MGGRGVRRRLRQDSREEKAAQFYRGPSRQKSSERSRSWVPAGLLEQTAGVLLVEKLEVVEA